MKKLFIAIAAFAFLFSASLAQAESAKSKYLTFLCGSEENIETALEQRDSSIADLAIGLHSESHLEFSKQIYLLTIDGYRISERINHSSYDTEDGLRIILKDQSSYHIADLSDCMKSYANGRTSVVYKRVNGLGSKSENAPCLCVRSLKFHSGK
jgi:hypothetical protein